MLRGLQTAKSTEKASLAVFLVGLAIASCAWIGVYTTSAFAYAALEGPPTSSAAPGLPDGRVYELVSPAQKDGNQAGATTSPFDTGGLQHYGLASPGGGSVLFEGTGPIGESPWAASLLFVATKNKEAPGWSTRALLPAAQQPLAEIGGLLQARGYLLQPSQDLSHAMLEAGAYTLAAQPNESCHNQLYLAGAEPFQAATWLERTSLTSPVENCAESSAGAPAGGTPSFSTVYFTYPGTLLPEDASRAPHAGTGENVEAWGFYEDTEGVLHEAGVLPDGSLDPFGAVPAASGYGANRVGNEVSTTEAPDGAPAGSRAFFVSPDPMSCAETNGGQNDCTTDPPELYVREHGEKTLLISQDTLLPDTNGQPASAPTGALAMHNPTVQNTTAGTVFHASYVFASPDGSQAFFQSESALTQAAQEASPGTEPKTYDFDVDTGTLTYLPGVTGEILASATNGSSFAFVRPETGSEPESELALWSTSTEGGPGTITPIAQLSGGRSSGRGEYVSDTQMSSDGSSVVFVTATSISPTFNSGGFEQIYRYDTTSNTLGCISCARKGVTPRGNAWMSVLRAGETYEKAEQLQGIVEDRAVSADGQRIFFDSPDPLVPQDANTNDPELPFKEEEYRPQGRDVYEWENGIIYLITTGQSTRNSYLIGSSENGNNVFFSTAEGLTPEDTDGGYDVYDARVPQPGDTPPATAVPCEGSVCQGPPNVPSPLTPPSSATFSGLGNPTPEVTPATTTKTTTKTVKCAKGKKLSHGKCLKVKSKKAKKKAKKASRAAT